MISTGTPYGVGGSVERLDRRLLPPLFVAWRGESRQRDWLEAQQWRSIGDGKTWLQALQACNALGPGWRLPRPHELPIYVASEPEALHGARGKLWTSVTSERSSFQPGSSS